MKRLEGRAGHWSLCRLLQSGFGAWLVLALLLPAGEVYAQASPGKRVALLIGNARYESERELANPLSDVALLAGVLRKDLQFTEVVERRNLTRRQLVDLVREVRQLAAGADAVVVYYSGHGMQGPNGNYLIPVDARIEHEDQVPSEALNARDIVDALRIASPSPRVAVLVLDACRDNPYNRRTKSTNKGLGRMNVSGGNLLVAYATVEGTTADDGVSGNSPYARALAQHLKQTDQPLLAQFDAVRRTTLQLTGNKQSPTREGDLEVSTFLVNPFGAATASNRAAVEAAAWGLCEKGNTKLPCEDYLSGWPQGSYVALARTRIRDLEAARLASQPQGVGVASARRQAGERFRDCAACPEMVVVRAGRFTMGSPADEAGRLDSEGPQHEVEIRQAFALGRTEVTVGEFKRFVQASGYLTQAERNVDFEGCFVIEEGDGKLDWRKGKNWKDPGFSQGEGHPVVCVSWNDAQAYARWLGQQTGQMYRLPSEAEWEYAARAGTRSSRPWGDDANQVCRHANGPDQTSSPSGRSWRASAECKDGHWYTAPVGSYEANAWGLHDLLGNAEEWVQDVWHENYDESPADGSAWLIAKEKTLRVLRGGSWMINIRGGLRSAARMREHPNVRNSFFGFRVARSD